MSAFMLSDAHADFIATAYVQFIDAQADPQAVGRELLEENARSLRALYAERNGLADEGEASASAYRFQPWRGNIAPENLNKQARCAAYQCCEHGEEWTASASGQRIAQLIEATGGGGDDKPLSDAYPWGIDERPTDDLSELLIDVRNFLAGFEDCEDNAPLVQSLQDRIGHALAGEA